MYDFAKEMNFDVKAMGNKSTRDRTLVKLFKSPDLMVSASGVSKNCNQKNYFFQKTLMNYVRDGNYCFKKYKLGTILT